MTSTETAASDSGQRGDFSRADFRCDDRHCARRRQNLSTRSGAPSGQRCDCSRFEDGTVALVRQYRHPAVRYLLEVPAGTLNQGERPEEGAARELEEELGFVAGDWKSCQSFMSRPVFAKRRCGSISQLR